MKYGLTSIIIFFCFLFFAPFSFATTFDLYAPTGPFNRGQEVTFTITINTEGATLNNTSVGMTYDTNYLEYVNTLPGDAFNTITTDNLGGGKLVFYGNSSSGFSGSGKFTDVVFRLIAQAPGSTELCVLWNPSSNPQSTITPASNQATQTPKTGHDIYSQKISLIAAGLLTLSTGLIFIKKRRRI